MKVLAKHLLVPGTMFILVLAVEVGMGMHQESIGLTISGHASNRCGQVPEGLQLSARIERESVKSGEPILLKISMKNVTKKVLYVFECVPERDYTITVRNESGEIVPLTEYGQKLLKSAEEYRRVRATVRSGQEVQVNIWLDNIYRMTKGTYSITVKRSFSKSDGKGVGELTSNPVRVRVL